ncbi:MAG TPA: ATP-binding protein [Candidatus Limnocylindrales bacterium]|nr:ATP-binding protein [Candidatus Limnocylindrales bacterium]
MIRRPNGIGLRIAVAAIAVAAVALGVLALGVMVVGGQTFADLMASHGEPAESSRSMFEASVVRVLLVTAVLASIAALVLAALVGRRLARPLQEIGAAARRIARGDHAGRIPRTGPDEIVGLADSFNQMAAALEEQERMRREFIANAAHELRTPLTNLKGYLEALRDGVVTPEPGVFASLLDETERLVRLSRSLDTLAEGDAGPPRPLVELDLARSVRSAVDLAAPGFRAAGIELDVDIPEQLPALADPDGLAQVLANLLQNAVRYTPPGGRVTIHGETRSGDVLVTVANTGPGIPADDLPHVFERFYRVEKSRAASRGGAGIGLAIVRQLVEAAGGRVGAESANGLTRVWFSLPALEG